MSHILCYPICFFSLIRFNLRKSRCFIRAKQETTRESQCIQVIHQAVIEWIIPSESFPPCQTPNQSFIYVIFDAWKENSANAQASLKQARYEISISIGVGINTPPELRRQRFYGVLSPPMKVALIGRFRGKHHFLRAFSSLDDR